MAAVRLGTGPRVDGRDTLLFCAWLAWSRFRVVLPARDRTLPSLLSCVDTTLRRVGGAPTYALTDNEKTVTVEHIARVPVRHPDVVTAGRHYGMTIRACVPADPQTKGGSEATVRIAKADLVPTETNLLDDYASFAELETACRQFCDRVNAWTHRATGRAPVEMLAEEATRLHTLPVTAVTTAFGETRRVGWDATISVMVVTVVDAAGPREVARHPRGRRGTPQIRDEHYPDTHPSRRSVPGDRTPRAGSASEEAFLAIGPGAADWLTEAAAAGTTRVRSKMAEAVSLAKLRSMAAVDQALGAAALAGRFAEDDLPAILDHQRSRPPAATPARASEAHSPADRDPRLGPVRRPGTDRPDTDRPDTDIGNRSGGDVVIATSTKDAGKDASSETTSSTTTAPPPASRQSMDEMLRLARRLRMHYLCQHAPDVLATARAQRWDPAEVLRVLLAEEITGRDEATIRLRRRKAGFPAGKTFEAWDERASSIPAASQQALRTLEWVDRHENLCVCGPSGTGKSHFCEALGQATVDRLLHHSHICLTEGESFRLAQATTGKGVKPLPT